MKKTNIEENIKNRVIDLITEGSEDRLIVFKSKEDDKAVDLIIKKRGEYKISKTPKQSKTSLKTRRIFSALPKGKGRELSFKVNIVEDISQEKISLSKDSYLMFVHFDEVKQKIDNIYIIPPNKEEKILIDQKELGNFLLEIIEAKK